MDKKLFRSRSNRMIGGVCAGIADYFGIDPTIVRILWAISVFVFGCGGLLYLLAWIIMPESPY